jgi:hypothetical protein
LGIWITWLGRADAAAKGNAIAIDVARFQTGRVHTESGNARAAGTIRSGRATFEFVVLTGLALCFGTLEVSRIQAGGTGEQSVAFGVIGAKDVLVVAATGKFTLPGQHEITTT